jgi:hypothetical protein
MLAFQVNRVVLALLPTESSRAGLSLCSASGQESDLWGGHRHHRGQAQRRSHLPVLSGHPNPGHPLAAGLVAPQPDRASLSHPEASAGDRRVPGSQ